MVWALNLDERSAANWMNDTNFHEMVSLIAMIESVLIREDWCDSWLLETFSPRHQEKRFNTKHTKNVEGGRYALTWKLCWSFIRVVWLSDNVRQWFAGRFIDCLGHWLRWSGYGAEGVVGNWWPEIGDRFLSLSPVRRGEAR